ncbi:UNVERIFIED_CONTAM: hypothetical protein FKN15_029710 [Acipenser sinensis]
MFPFNSKTTTNQYFWDMPATDQAKHEQHRSVFRPAQSSTPQPIPVFLDFLEEVKSSWQQPASALSVSKSAAPLAFLAGAGALGLAQFPPIDSITVALVKAPPVGGLSKNPVCPNSQCRITEAHLKKVYAAKVQVTCLANTGGLLTAYLFGMQQSVSLPELLASELHLVSGTLLHLSGFQGQALGRSLVGLVVARRLWLSQVRVQDADKSTLLDAPISPGHTFRPVVEELLQRSHREQEASQQVAAMLPSHAPAQEKVVLASGSYYTNPDSSSPHCITG